MNVTPATMAMEENVTTLMNAKLNHVIEMLFVKILKDHSIAHVMMDSLVMGYHVPILMNALKMLITVSKVFRARI